MTEGQNSIVCCTGDCSNCPGADLGCTYVDNRTEEELEAEFGVRRMSR